MERICDMIAKKRRDLGLTQTELGNMLGISGKAVSKWERGLSNPCREHMEKLVDLLGLPVESSMSTEETEQIPPQRTPFTFPRELPRIFATATILAVCVCYMSGTLSTESTMVSLGLAVVLFCLWTMISR